MDICTYGLQAQVCIRTMYLAHRSIIYEPKERKMSITALPSQTYLRYPNKLLCVKSRDIAYALSNQLSLRKYHAVKFLIFYHYWFTSLASVSGDIIVFFMALLLCRMLASFQIGSSSVLETRSTYVTILEASLALLFVCAPFNLSFSIDA